MVKSALYHESVHVRPPTKTAVPLLDRTASLCSYPLWPTSGPAPAVKFCCGAPVSIGSYCSVHAELCYRLDVTPVDVERELNFAANRIGKKVGATRDYLSSL